jgi:alpha-methylacyl-CoA racemase
MSEGSAYASGFLWSMGHMFPDTPGTNILDGGAHFYGCYKTNDNRYMAVGAIEPQFYRELILLLNLTEKIDLADQMDQSTWGPMKIVFQEIFEQKSLAEWTQIFVGSQACTTPVLTKEEAEKDPHNVERNAFMIDDHNSAFPTPAPKFSRTSHSVSTERPEVGENSKEILENVLGINSEEIKNLFTSGAVA